MVIIYGVDTEKPITPKDVRDAIVRCFVEAHGEILDLMRGTGSATSVSDEDFEKMKKMNVKELIRGFFQEAGGDYENPTKESLIAVCDRLAEFAKNFRKPEVIEKHYGEIMQLMEKL